MSCWDFSMGYWGVLPDVPPFVGSDQAILGEVTTIGSGTTQGMARGV